MGGKIGAVHREKPTLGGKQHRSFRGKQNGGVAIYEEPKAVEGAGEKADPGKGPAGFLCKGGHKVAGNLAGLRAHLG